MDFGLTVRAETSASAIVNAWDNFKTTWYQSTSTLCG